jgi:pre-60S factor REI1
VTKEWFDAKKSQLVGASQAKNMQKVWFDPLAKKKFYSENTYTAFTRSKKYLDMVKKSGKPAPEPVISINKKNEVGGTTQSSSSKDVVIQGATLKPVTGSMVDRLMAHQKGGGEEEDDDMEDSGSEWETASDEEDPSSWEKWDVCQSLFDNHVSKTMEDNLEYMWKKYGFYLPDSKYLKDPEGMLQYLGAKMQYGKLPLYESGLNPEAKRLASLHGVQRHMVDSGKCKIIYEGNEDEYEDYYDYGDDEVNDDDEASASQQLIVPPEDLPSWFAAAAGYELAIPSQNNKGGENGGVKILGSREFARYYKQRHRAGDFRASTAAALVVSKYNQLTVPILGDGTVEGMRRAEQKRTLKCKQRVEKIRLAASLRRNVNDNLPKNVPY